MRFSLRSSVLVLLVGGAGCFSSCTKSEPQPQAPAPMGAVIGQVSPANALTSATATSAGGGQAYTATINASGSYAFVSLPVGNYIIAYVAAPGYVSPASQTTSVTVNNTTTLPALTVQAQTGTVVGQVMPADALTSVTATAANGSTVQAVISPAGTYTFANLAVGTYTITYTAAPGYNTPPAQTATVVSGGTVTLPALALQFSRISLLTARRWRVTAATTTVTTSGTTTTSDDYATSPGCERDDFTQFRADKTVLFDEGATKCNTADPQTRNGTWDFNSDQTRLLLTSPDFGGVQVPFDVVTLNATTLSIRYTSAAQGTSVVSNQTFTAF